ncbi:glycoside hydrolase family 99-like domain-containing protein [Allobaculum sp. Allo2]|nr:glycoside hydrolase family 99-like domain-containing protein [Allobaculum sp. Allo2]
MRPGQGPGTVEKKHTYSARIWRGKRLGIPSAVFSALFKDERYIKIDNKPVLLLYTSSRIQNCAEMVDFGIEDCANMDLMESIFSKRLTIFSQSLFYQMLLGQ